MVDQRLTSYMRDNSLHEYLQSTYKPSITVTNVPVLNEPVDNLGAVFDPNRNVSAHVSNVIKSANYHL